ncbi:MAG TPA: transporter substrate-binding domain-containing protein, partial [Propionibacteriaceae bacterium]|nr:transporter substrate-binding domain-containing protein [Propionibacteriaceae bacterium]
MKKHLTLLIALVLSCTALAACSAENTTTGPAAPLRVGMELAYPPFETKDAAGHPSGISVDLATDLAAYLKRPVDIQNIAWDGLIPSLQSNKIDVVISSMTIT